MPPLALQSSPATPSPRIAAHVWAALPTACKDKVNMLKSLVLRCVNLPHGKRRARFEEIAASAGTDSAGKPLVDAETLRKKLYAFQERGEVALIDHKLCGGKCGQAECGNVSRQRAIPTPLVDEFAKRMVENKAVTNDVTSTRNMKHVWRTIMRDLCAGVSLPGVGTWKDVYRAEYPTRPMKPNCPYSEQSRPHGWSYQTFVSLKPELMARVVAQRGIADVMPFVSPVRMDWSLMRPQEFLIFDDHDFNFLVVGEFEGKPMLARLSVLMVMDACTRTIRWAQVFPKYVREDNTKVGISRRNAQHCIAHYFAAHGVPKYWDTHMIVENATAAITDVFQDTLSRVSGGRIHVHRTGLHDGKVKVSGFAEATGGNPRGMKAALEKFWGIIDVALGHLPAQVGESYDNKPGDHNRLEQRSRQLLKKFGGIATGDELMRLMDVNSLPMAKLAILDALHLIENREDHELVGFETRTEWRQGLGFDWLPCVGPDMAAFVKDMGMSAVNLHLAKPGMTRTVTESPRAKWERLRHASDFYAFPPESLADMLCDRVRVRDYRGNGEIRIKWDGREFLFEGLRHAAREGQHVDVAFDADDASLGAVLFDENGSYLGRMDYKRRLDPLGDEARGAALGKWNASLAGAISDARLFAEPREMLEHKIEQAKDRLALVQELEQRKDLYLPADKRSKALAAAREGDTAGALLSRGKPVATEADDIATIEANRRAIMQRKLARAS